jgi:hypothetical protein
MYCACAMKDRDSLQGNHNSSCPRYRGAPAVQQLCYAPTPPMPAPTPARIAEPEVKPTLHSQSVASAPAQSHGEPTVSIQ